MNDTALSKRKCQPCEGGVSPLDREAAETLSRQTPGWDIDGAGKLISRKYQTRDFMAAIEFMTKIGYVAQADDHHPDLHLTGYRNLEIVLSTHAIGGLSENDFILAAKINELHVDLKN